MQIVIDIPEDVIESAKSSPNYYPAYHFEEIWRAIANGIPLDKIRAEIMKLQTYKMFGGEDTVYVEHEDVLQVIDKYKAESE